MKNSIATHTNRRRSFSTYVSLLSIIQSTQRCNGFGFATNTMGKISSIPFIRTKNNVIFHEQTLSSFTSKTTSTNLNLRAPPGSGYYTDEDEPNYFPETYEPMMEYPGTMRPGRTPENQPYSSLPIQESDPDPVPWPHFQEVEWHHNWGSPHEHPIPMEEFIELHDRWASAEVEAEMRAGARRNVRNKRAQEEAEKALSFIVDDDDEDDEDDEEGGVGGTKLDIGEGVDALIGAGVEAAASIASPRKAGTGAAVVEEEEEDGDNFLSDLGLDDIDESDDDEEEDDVEGDDGDEPAFATGDDDTGGLVEALQSMIDAEDDSAGAVESGGDDDDDDNEIDIDFDDLGLNFDDDDEEEDEEDEEEEGDNDSSGGEFVMDDDDITLEGDDLTLDEMIGNEDMGADDEFDDGGFDYD